jgi:hypothetical protein
MVRSFIADGMGSCSSGSFAISTANIPSSTA